MRIAGQRPRGQIVDGFLAPLGVNCPCCRIAAEHMHRLQIEEVRRMQGFPLSEQARFQARGRRRLEEHLECGRGINHDHGWSRRSRMTSAGGTSGITGVR
jgi:hypothetical protein